MENAVVFAQDRKSDLQIDDLKAAGCEKNYVEMAVDRPVCSLRNSSRQLKAWRQEVRNSSRHGSPATHPCLANIDIPGL